MASDDELPANSQSPVSQHEEALRTLALRSDAPDRYGDPDAFDAFARGHDLEFAGPRPLSRYLAALRRTRPDLLDAYPQVPGFDVPGLQEWAHTFGREQVPIPQHLLPPAQSPLASTYQQPGVNLAGFLNAELGVGEVGRRLANALEIASIPHANVGFDKTTNRNGVDFAVGDDPRFDTNIVCVNADSWGAFAQHMGPSFFAGRYTIAVWFWETSVFPPMFRGATKGTNEIWVASHYVADILRRAVPADIRVVQFPLPIVAPTVSDIDPRVVVGLPADATYFVTSFDFNSIVERKNPIGAIEAFVQAFPDGDGPRLVVKSINGAAHPDAMAQVVSAAGSRADVIIHDGYLDAATNAALIAHSAGLISLHRAEGFGFNVADAMALSVPVIATDYSGSQEFTLAEDCWLVPAHEVEVGEGQFPYLPDAVWADPELDVAAGHLRSIAASPTEATKKAKAAAGRVLREFAPTRSGEFMRNRIAAIRAERALAQTAPGSAPEPKRRWFVRGG